MVRLNTCCAKDCECTLFEEVNVSKYNGRTMSIHTQLKGVVEKIVLYRCLSCGQLHFAGGGSVMSTSEERELVAELEKFNVKTFNA